MKRETKRKLDQLVESYGASYTLDQTGKSHDKVTFTLGGISRFITVSSTPRCSRAVQNFLGDARRTLKQLQEQTQ